MTREEVKNLLNKIKIYRSYFGFEFADSKERKDMFIDEWFNKLAPYDAEDIDKNLEKFLMDEENIGKNPDLYQLIKRTLKSKDKKIKGRIYSRCMFCGKEIDYVYDKHEKRCRSVKYISRMCSKYLDKKVDEEELYQMEERTFKKRYILTLEKLLPNVKEYSPLEARCIENVIETYYGREPRYSLKEI